MQAHSGAFSLLFWLCLLCSFITALKYDSEYVEWNLNTNKTATNVLDYSGQWENHTYMASPKNWRFPFYTIFPDRFVNGDPTNDDWNQTAFESDPNGNQMRHGGDMQGLIDTLDYIQGFGIKVGSMISQDSSELT